jgi:hypothetical protein
MVIEDNSHNIGTIQTWIETAAYSLRSQRTTPEKRPIPTG